MDEFEKLALVTRETFLPYVGSVYRVTDGHGNTGEVLLHELTCREEARPEAQRVPFSVFFRGPHDVPMTQGTYHFENPDGESLLIFVVPVGPDPDGEGLLYQAIFS